MLYKDHIGADYLEEIYHDTFKSRATQHMTFARPIDLAVVSSGGCASAGKTSGSVNASDSDSLRLEKEALEKKNGELMRILVAHCLHY